ncbi:pentapeptide repeat-containing protein [Microcoleus sp. FACHB-1515]|uniref:pentapeptide repeat-containing protein n=1 Tax=Cyanophyceae TaxID=3028117 RepID=UPI001684E9B8|nr:pentapeptide repeat-containing protein [Microcoleus sp. FACHB-1515]MBD2091031.1 pentapeptide repeat-containing protein [Microcoleus sp. FACHB-1515]
MTPDSQPPTPDSTQPKILSSLNGEVASEAARSNPATWQAAESAIAPRTPAPLAKRQQPPQSLLVLLTIAIMLAGWWLNLSWVALAGAIVALLIAGRIVWTALRPVLAEIVSDQQVTVTVSIVGVIVAIYSVLRFTGITRRIADWYGSFNWDALGASAELLGAVGQIAIAVLAVYVAWRQYIISRDLTIQQNLITQQQTIDSYFQGISELVLDEEGLLEDVPQERAIAEGRTAAILSSVDGTGKAKILRFLSRSRLLTPLRRDRRLGRAILDGTGGYAEDREYGVRVIDLGVMLAVSNLAGTDLRWTDLSDANLIRANLSRCDLVKTNLARTILYEADLSGSDMMGTRLFYGPVETASPRSRTDLPDYKTGAFTGAVIENADFSNVVRLSEEQRQYCCAWGGSATRSTIPGGCEGIPNRLGR